MNYKAGDNKKNEDHSKNKEDHSKNKRRPPQERRPTQIHDSHYDSQDSRTSKASNVRVYGY